MIGFKKLKFFTNENIGAGNLELPENEMHTTSYWITLERAHARRSARVVVVLAVVGFLIAAWVLFWPRAGAP